MLAFHILDDIISGIETLKGITLGMARL